MAKTKEIDIKTYNELCDEVRHVLTISKLLTTRAERLEKLIDKLATEEGLDNGT